MAVERRKATMKTAALSDHCGGRHEECDPSSEQGAVGRGAAAERRQDRRSKDGDAGGPDEQQATQPCLHRVGSPVARHRPGDVHRVLQRLSDTEGAVERDQATDNEGHAAALETLRIAQLVADDRELAQRRVEDPLLEVAVVLEQEPKHRRQQEEQREERQETVERDQRRQEGTLVFEELVDHRKGKPGPTMSSLVPVKPLSHPHAGAPRAIGPALLIHCRTDDDYISTCRLNQQTARLRRWRTEGARRCRAEQRPTVIGAVLIAAATPPETRR